MSNQLSNHQEDDLPGLKAILEEKIQNLVEENARLVELVNEKQYAAEQAQVGLSEVEENYR